MDNPRTDTLRNLRQRIVAMEALAKGPLTIKRRTKRASKGPSTARQQEPRHREDSAGNE